MVAIDGESNTAGHEVVADFAAESKYLREVDCPIGQYLATVNWKQVCLPCLPGTVANKDQVKKNVCYPCRPGQYAFSGFACVSCSAGQYSDVPANTCKSCASGRDF